MKQTAVEWLVEQMIERKFFAKDTPLSYTTLEHLTNQAKAMEKEQIKNSFVECWKANIPDGIECKLDAEQYYNETYKSKQ